MDRLTTIDELADLWDLEAGLILPPAYRQFSDEEISGAKFALFDCDNVKYWQLLFRAMAKDNYCLGKSQESDRPVRFGSVIRHPKLRLAVAQRANINVNKFKSTSLYAPQKEEGIGFAKTKADKILEPYSLSEDTFNTTIALVEENFGKEYNQANKRMLYKFLYILDAKTFGHVCEQLVMKFEWLPKVNQVIDVAAPYMRDAKEKRKKILEGILINKNDSRCILCNNTGSISADKLGYSYAFTCSCEFGKLSENRWPKWEDRLFSDGFKVLPWGKPFELIGQNSSYQ